MKKKGLSPVIATVLLIAVVIVIALILFLWFRGMTEESITKFGGENIKLVCDRVDFNADYSDGTFYISNRGNVPIYGLNLKIHKNLGQQSYSIRNVATSDWWPREGLGQGLSASGGIGNIADGADKIEVIPVLIGESNEGEKTYLCDGSNGIQEITL